MLKQESYRPCPNYPIVTQSFPRVKRYHRSNELVVKKYDLIFRIKVLIIIIDNANYLPGLMNSIM